MLEYSGTKEMKRSITAAAILDLRSSGRERRADAVASRSARLRPSRQALAGAALPAILAAEDSRLPLPDDLHTPGIDTLRAKQIEDLRLLLELARSKDAATHVAAVRALGRLERRDLIPDLLPYLVTGSAREAAHAIAQSFRGAPLANDTAGQQVDQAFEALVTVGAISTDPRRGPGPIGAVALAVGRLPYGDADQVRAAESYLLRTLRTVEPRSSPSRRPDRCRACVRVPGATERTAQDVRATRRSTSCG